MHSEWLQCETWQHGSGYLVDGRDERFDGDERRLFTGWSVFWFQIFDDVPIASCLQPTVMWQCPRNFCSFHDRVSSHHDQFHGFATQRWRQLKETAETMATSSDLLLKSGRQRKKQQIYSRRSQEQLQLFTTRNSKNPWGSTPFPSPFNPHRWGGWGLRTLVHQGAYGSAAPRRLLKVSWRLQGVGKCPVETVEIWGFRDRRFWNFFFSHFFSQFFHIFFFFVSWVLSCEGPMI